MTEIQHRIYNGGSSWKVPEDSGRRHIDFVTYGCGYILKYDIMLTGNRTNGRDYESLKEFLFFEKMSNKIEIDDRLIKRVLSVSHL